MKIKKLSATVISLTLCLLTSCIGSDNATIEYSTDDTIHAFALPTIHGIDYAFTIDQAHNKIYNIDSLPFRSDTIINKTLIKTLSSMGYITSGDTLFNYAKDSIDLSNTMNAPLILKVTAPDGINKRQYSIRVLVHQQDPDTLVWNKMSNSFSNEEITASQKAAILGNKLFVYTSNTTAYSSFLSDGHTWEKRSLTGLPENVNLSSLQSLKNKFYASTSSGNIYVSEDGEIWEKQNSLSGDNIVTLLTTFPETISAIIKEGGENKYCISNATMTGWIIGDTVASNFPLNNVSSTLYTTDTGLNKVFLVDKDISSTSTKITPWFSLDGKNWAEASTTSKYYCPQMNNPSIIHYNNIFYAFGSDFSAFYTSRGGIAWNKVTSKMAFPSELSERSSYTMVVDYNNYIWIICNKEGAKSNAVWRGRINRLGFLVK